MHVTWLFYHAVRTIKPLPRLITSSVRCGNDVFIALEKKEVICQPCIDTIFRGLQFFGDLWGGSSSSVEAQRPNQHIIGHFGDDFYKPDDQTNSVKALKETSWSSRSGLNPTRTTPPCHNNTTPDNRLYTQRKAGRVPMWQTQSVGTCKNWSYKCTADCEHCVTQSSTEQFW